MAKKPGLPPDKELPELVQTTARRLLKKAQMFNDMAYRDNLVQKASPAYWQLLYVLGTALDESTASVGAMFAILTSMDEETNETEADDERGGSGKGVRRRGKRR